MITLFRTLNPISMLVLFALALFLRISMLWNMPESLNFAFVESYTKFLMPEPLSASLSPLLNVFVTTIVVFLQALLFNAVINNHGLFAKASYLPALLYVVSCSLFMSFFVLSPALICNFFTIWLIDKYLRAGKSNQGIMLMFDCGMIVALGTLIYFPFIMMLPLTWLCLLWFRPFNWREWMATLFGYFTIIFFLAVFYYWQDQLPQFYKIWLPLINTKPVMFQLNYDDYWVLLPVLLLLVLSFLRLRENFYKSFILTRKAYQLFFAMFLMAIFSFYFKPGFRIWHFLLAVPSGSLFLTYYFSNAKKPWIYESLFVILLICIQVFLFV